MAGKIVVTGASGSFGHSAAELLFERCAPEDLIFLSRTPEKLSAFADRGATVRLADFDQRRTLKTAMQGGEKLLLISTARVGTRIGQHKNAIDAAVAQGVTHIVYTSIIAADDPANPAIVRYDHRSTEEIIEKSGVDWTHLRDSQYSEAIAQAMAITALQSGRQPSNWGDGKVGFVSRSDCVATAVGVLTQDGHAKKAYTLTGPERLSVREAMDIVTDLTGKTIVTEQISDQENYAFFDTLGVPRHASDVVLAGPIPWSSDDMVTFGQAIRAGFFDKLTDTVETITGRAPKSLRQVMIESRPSWPN